ncbi:MAG: type II secretion system protein [Akkermansiaceae bacterium]
MKTSRRRANRPQCGFTLVELLVVIAIISVLSAIIAAISLKAAAAGRSTKDLAQLRGLGVGITAYASEHGRYPLSQEAGGEWRFWMDYVRGESGLSHLISDQYSLNDVNPFISQRLNVNVPSNSSQEDLRSLSHYSAVEAIMPWRPENGYRGVPETAVKRPSGIAMLVDASRPENKPLMSAHINLWGEFRSSWYNNNPWATADDPNKGDDKIHSENCKIQIDFRHNWKAHVLFADGHVENLGPGDFYYRMFSNAY